MIYILFAQEEIQCLYGRNENPSYALIDSQSVKTTSASEKTGYDGGKKRKAEKDI